MVLPKEIGDAAQDADAARVKAWLDSGGDINDGDEENYTLIHCCAIGTPDEEQVTSANVSLAQTLIALGANVNICNSYGDSPLLEVLENAWRGRAWPDMLKLLLQAKANPNGTNRVDKTPLQIPLRHAIALDDKYELSNDSNPPLNLQTSRSLIALRLLLRAGASLDHKVRQEDAADGWETATAEFWIESHYGNQDDERVIAMKALLAGVRQHGTYKKYMRAPHREFLAVRGLAQRGKLRTEHRALNFIAKLGERGVVWHILTYWRPTE